jgi:hypothetical protein
MPRIFRAWEPGCYFSGRNYPVHDQDHLRRWGVLVDEYHIAINTGGKYDGNQY